MLHVSYRIEELKKNLKFFIPLFSLVAALNERKFSRKYFFDFVKKNSLEVYFILSRHLGRVFELRQVGVNLTVQDLLRQDARVQD